LQIASQNDKELFTEYEPKFRELINLFSI